MTAGYSLPPKDRRFKKGESGNLKGRPTRQRGAFADDLARELSEVIQVTEGGCVRRITKQRALIKALTAGAIKGNTRAAGLLIRWCVQVIDARSGRTATPALSASDRKIVEDYLDREVEQRLAAKNHKETK